MWTEELADGEIMAALFIYFTMTLKRGRFYSIIYHLQPFEGTKSLNKTPFH